MLHKIIEVVMNSSFVNFSREAINRSSINSTVACETSYAGKIYLNDAQKGFLKCVDLTIMIFNIWANLSVIYSLVATKQLNNTSFRLILFLCVSDCCLGMTTQPLFAIMIIGYTDHTYCNLEITVQFFAILLTHTSMYSICLIGLDRFCRMKYLLRYSDIVTFRRVHISIVLVTCLSFIQATVYTVSSMFEVMPLYEGSSFSC